MLVDSKRSLFAAALVAMAILTSSCEKKPSPTEQQAPKQSKTEKNFQAESSQLWGQASVAAKQSQQAVSDFQRSINTFLNAPSSESLLKAQQEWKKAALAYSKLHMVSELVAANSRGFQALKQLDFRVAAHPVQPGYLDAFGPYLYSGLVNDISIEITLDVVSNQHGLTDDSDVILGLYAIEFMLFGDANQRKAEDYTLQKELSQTQKETGFRSIEETPSYRRQKLLNTQVQLLAQDINTLASVVKPAGKTAPNTWLALNSDQKIAASHRALERALSQMQLQASMQKKLTKRENDDKSNEEAANKAAENGTKNDKQEPDEGESSSPQPPASLSYRHLHTLTAEETAELLSNKIDAMKLYTPFVEQEALHALLEEAQTSLNEFINDTENAKAPWQSVHNKLEEGAALLRK